MLWNPAVDDLALIQEFLTNYYGLAAPFVQLYMDTVHGAIDETNYVGFRPTKELHLLKLIIAPW